MAQTNPTVTGSADALASQRTGRWQHLGSASSTLSGRAVLAAWAVSVAIHIVLFFIMVALVFPFAPKEAPAPRPTAQADILGPISESKFVPNSTDQPIPSLTAVDQQPKRYTPREFTKLADVSSFKKPELSIIGIGAGGGDAPNLGLAIGNAGGPEFFGLGSSSRGVRRIVYVVDRSGSMLDTFGYVQQELERSITALRRSQKFHVIFFSTGAPVENPPRRLVSGITAHKAEFFRFLQTVVASGGTEPGPALKRALDLEPDLVYLLSDGVDFDPGLMKNLDSWNKKRNVQIFTIAYLDRSGSELLELIAREHGGAFKYVTEHDLP